MGLERVGMDAIRDFLGWSTEGAHTAMKDAEDAMNLFDLLWRSPPERVDRYLKEVDRYLKEKDDKPSISEV